MRNLAAIEYESRRAAQRAAAEGDLPFLVRAEDIAYWRAQLGNGVRPTFPFPFTGQRRWHGRFRYVRNYIVDALASSPGDAEGAMLSVPEFVRQLRPDYGYVIFEAIENIALIGEFQPGS
jgi:hypothetical protein